MPDATHPPGEVSSEDSGQLIDFPRGTGASPPPKNNLPLQRSLTNAQIGQELFISPRTVDRHLNSIYCKTGASSRVAATRFASDHNLT
jgi:Bacterial regulatory proteins, luxR family